MLFAALAGLTLASACASERAGPTVASAEAAGEAAMVPEPGVVPCKNCGVDVTGRVTGALVAAKCGEHGSVAFPVSALTIEVLEGEQAGARFAVTTDPEELDAGARLEGEAEAEAKPEGWLKAEVLTTDADGKVCASPLSIYR